MSVVSNIHTLVKLDRNTTALSGQRLVRLIAKADRNGKYPSANLTESLAVSVPVVSDEEIVDVIDQLMPHLRSYIASVQDSVIREFRIEHGRDEVPSTAFNMAACIAYLDESSKGDRVTKEYLAEWFGENYATAAGSWIRSIAGTELADDIVDAKVVVLRDMFASMASPKANPNIPTLKAMIRFASAIASDASISVCSRMNAMNTRCIAMLKKKEEELSSDALGF